MSGVKRTRTDEITTSSQAPTTSNVSPKIEPSPSFNSNIEEDYNWLVEMKSSR